MARHDFDDRRKSKKSKNSKEVNKSQNPTETQKKDKQSNNPDYFSKAHKEYGLDPDVVKKMEERIKQNRRLKNQAPEEKPKKNIFQRVGQNIGNTFRTGRDKIPNFDRNKSKTKPPSGGQTPIRGQPTTKALVLRNQNSTTQKPKKSIFQIGAQRTRIGYKKAKRNTGKFFRRGNQSPIKTQPTNVYNRKRVQPTNLYNRGKKPRYGFNHARFNQPRYNRRKRLKYGQGQPPGGQPPTGGQPQGGNQNPISRVNRSSKGFGVFWFLNLFNRLLFNWLILGGFIIFINFLFFITYIFPNYTSSIGSIFWFYYILFMVFIGFLTCRTYTATQNISETTSIGEIMVVSTITAFSSLLFTISIFRPEDLIIGDSINIGVVIFMLIVFIFIITDLYQRGHRVNNISSFNTIVIVSVFILLFAYVAFGPFSGIYQENKQLLEEPIIDTFGIIGGQFTNIWLLATNPQEYFQRQNVVPEVENLFGEPQGLDITSIDVFPINPIFGREFSVSFEARHNGVLDIKGDVVAQATCDDTCIVHGKIKGYDPIKRGVVIRDVFRNIEATNNVEQAYLTTGFLNVTLTYIYFANSTLQVSVVDNESFSQVVDSGDFSNVRAIGSSTPLQIGIQTLGGSPVPDNSNISFILNLINSREDSKIVLDNTVLRVYAPDVLVGKSFECEPNDEYSIRPLEDELGLEIIIKSKEIILDEKGYDTTSAYPIFCSFDSIDVDRELSGIIRAEAENYKVLTTKKITIRYSPAFENPEIIEEQAEEQPGEETEPEGETEEQTEGESEESQEPGNNQGTP